MPEPTRQLVLVLAVLLVALALGLWVTPTGLPAGAWRMLLVAFGAAVLWMSEAVPMGITSLMVILALSVLDILPLRTGMSLVFHPVSAIVFAGFCLAAALHKHGLDLRLSLSLVLKLGSSTGRVVLGLMAATALLSTVISNTAATAVMVAIATGLLPAGGGASDHRNLARALMIGIPFAANIGGMATPVGTPGNALTIAMLRELTGVRVSFLAWGAFALPVVGVLVPLAWRVVVSLYPPGTACLDLSACREGLARLGPVGPGEKRVAAIIGFTVLLWAVEPFFRLPADWTSMVSLLAVVVLTVPGIGVLTWNDVHTHTGWNVFLLVGGGLALGTGLQQTGAVAWLAAGLTSRLAGLPPAALLLWLSAATACTILVFCTISGTAATMVPLAIGLALATGRPPHVLALAAGLSASFAFLLPANSAPNALAYGTGMFKARDMLRAGAVLMLAGVVVVTVCAVVVWPRLEWLL